MVFTNQEYLPSPKELEVEELNVSSPVLRAASIHMGKYCDWFGKEYLLCVRENQNDPRPCLKEGKAVTNCGQEFLRKIKQNCALEFTDYWQCLDHSWTDMNFEYCRKSQKKFDGCVLEKLGQERPEVGFFSRVRVHDTKRPRPDIKVPLPERVPEGIDHTAVPAPESVKLGTRFFGKTG